ncbi:hypothetical protein TIFTF001_028426 [Ficus carica]|uniref:Uncharacterized protein n=1 Tax=Ficus carica TaxID=3494 RepID=A0AA88J050_FICCA|nr:hypothetical protein TIFTF001_028426 [Ficus carica]
MPLRPEVKTITATWLAAMTKPTASSKAATMEGTTPTSRASSVGCREYEESWKKRKAEPEPGPEADLGAAELVVVGGEEEEEEGVVGACGAVFGSSTASFRMAEAPVVEEADLGRFFWGEGTRKKKKKKKKQRKEGREEASSRWLRSLWWSEGKKRKKKKKKK